MICNGFCARTLTFISVCNVRLKMVSLPHCLPPTTTMHIVSRARPFTKPLCWIGSGETRIAVLFLAVQEFLGHLIKIINRSRANFCRELSGAASTRFSSGQF